MGDNKKMVDNSVSNRDQVRCIDSKELFAEQTRVRIVHQGTEYQLQVTRQGKLILTK